MNAFVRVPPDVRENQVYRDTLLAQPPEFFRPYLGCVPDTMQKLVLVEKLIHLVAAPNVYVNDTYRVRVREVEPFVQLEISRRDGEACTNWRDFQQIKNEFVGPECEAVELFPAESRLVDTANQYHLWVMRDDKYRFPFGYQCRLVLDAPLVYRGRAGDQEAIPEHRWLPADSTAANAVPC